MIIASIESNPFSNGILGRAFMPKSTFPKRKTRGRSRETKIRPLEKGLKPIKRLKNFFGYVMRTVPSKYSIET